MEKTTDKEMALKYWSNVEYPSKLFIWELWKKSSKSKFNGLTWAKFNASNDAIEALWREYINEEVIEAGK